MNDLAQEFFAQTRSLRQQEIDWLVVERGVPPLALARDPGEIGFAIGAAKVVFSAGYFDFTEVDTEDAASAICIIARDETGDPADIIAWRPRDKVMAPHLGAVSVVGAESAFRPRLGESLRVHRDLLGWLRADRQGVVVLNADRARPLLSDVGPLQAEDVEHGLQLREAMRPPEPNIVVSTTSNASVAA